MEKKCSHLSRQCAKIVYAFYDPEFSFGDLVKRGEHLRGALTDCLIGNVDDQDFKELFESMSDLARLPEPVGHGLAKTSSEDCFSCARHGQLSLWGMHAG